jgi:hypothetical protein
MIILIGKNNKSATLTNFEIKRLRIKKSIFLRIVKNVIFNSLSPGMKYLKLCLKKKS